MLRNSRKFNLFDRWRGAFGRWATLAKWLNTVAQALNRAHSLSPLSSLEIGLDGGLEHDFDEAALLRLAKGTHPWMIDETADGQYHVHGGRVWHAPGAAATVAGADLGAATGQVTLCSTYSGTATEAHTIVAGTTFDYWTTLDKDTWRIATPLGKIDGGEIHQWQHSDLLAPLAPARAAVRFGDTPDELDAQFAHQDGVNAFDATSDVAVRFDILEEPTGATNVKLRARIKDFSAVAETNIDWTSISQTFITNNLDYTTIYNNLVNNYFDWTATCLDGLVQIRYDATAKKLQYRTRGIKLQLSAGQISIAACDWATTGDPAEDVWTDIFTAGCGS